MNRNEFIEQYYSIVERAVYVADKGRTEGLLALENDVNNEKASARDIFELGLRIVIDGTDSHIIDKLLSNIVNQEKDEQLHTLKTIQKEAVLMIQNGTHPYGMYEMMNSYTDIPFNEDKMYVLLEEKYFGKEEKNEPR